ncbi:MAG: phage terminase large subunit [Roseburia sp.]|nr:phage terminase large subunit [Anaeroplasma bactoclasticum]MCM1195500.1 phage terminase large subunit [Roseburia sp.]MCM1556878.1 phage terminase large subunit [Anaeroplasma bactoclasticum]
MTSDQNRVKISELIAPIFYDLWDDVRNGRYTEYDEVGGRGSTKSSIISLCIVYFMMLDRKNGIITHAVVLRQYQKDLRESVFEQIGWAIEKLGVAKYWRRTLSPMKWIYMPNSKYPQEVRFRGCDDPSKVKSIKFAYGIPAYLWFEEKDQFKSASDIQSIKLSIARKNDAGIVKKLIQFSSYNPPQNPSHWINIDAKKNKPYRHQHHSDYTQVPQEWLTEEFLEEAEATKANDINEYNHVFLGKVTGLKGLCYPMFDINKHTIAIDDFRFGKYEKVARVICGCDGGTILDATTLIPMLLTSAGRIVCLPTFYYDPQNLGHIPLGASKQVKLMEHWLDYWFKWLDKMHGQIVTPDDVTIVVDSAAQDIVLEFNTLTKYNAIKVPGKDVLIDMKRHQTTLTIPNYFILLNAGYIDPVTFRMVGDDDMYIVEISGLVVDEKTGKPIDENNHVIDGTNYGLKIATQIV